MDPITMTLAVASAGMKLAGGAMSMFGAGQQYRQAKRVTRMKQATLRQNADMAMAQSTFEQNRLDDQIDAVQGAQANYFAGGNLDVASGSPAVLQAMTEAQGETDKMLIAARGVQRRADAFQQISDLESGLNDQRVGMSYGVATTMLNTASELLAMFGPKGQFGTSGRSGGATIGGGGPMNINPGFGGSSGSWTGSSGGLY